MTRERIAMEREIKGMMLAETFWSVREFYDQAVADHDPGRTTIPGEVLKLVEQGWHEHAPAALDIAESAVSSSVRLMEASAFTPAWDVTGAEVDVARYLSGEPECMIDFPLTAAVKAGKVITLVSSADSNSGSDWLSRGILATSLGLALARLGYATEMWADNYGVDHGGTAASQYQRILVKSTADEVDPSRLMFAFGRSEMLNPLAFGVFDGYRKENRLAAWYRAFGRARGSAEPRPQAAMELYPEGTVFLTGQLTNATPETAGIAVEAELRGLGLID
jgi:hypothetical protein